MHLLLDSDSLMYRAGFIVNGEGQEALACWQLDKIIEGILEDVKPDTYKLYISGSGNFRYSIYPEYKANRTDMVRPMHLGTMREHLVQHWKAHVSDGCEADDMLGIDGYGKANVVLGHIDKDIDCIPGQHYNYNKNEWYSLDERESWNAFCMQLVQGDKGDNIPGFDGKMRPKLPQKLYYVRDAVLEAETEEEALVAVAQLYPSYSKFKLSADCLWILRKDNDRWEHWIAPETELALQEMLGMEEHGQRADGIHLSPPSSEAEVDDGPLNSSV